MVANSNVLTPQEIMEQATTAANRVSGMNPSAKAEAMVALADAQARLHRANQHEVENLFRVIEHKSFDITGEHRKKATKKLLSILGLDD